MARTLNAFFFDLDGTLVDTEPIHCAVLIEVLAAHGITLSADAYYRRYLSLTDHDTFLRAAADAARPDLAARVHDLVERKRRRMAERLARDLVLLPGAAAFVAAAATRAPLALVTGARRNEAEAALALDGLAGRFDVVVTADDVRLGKPDPEPYRVALERLRAHTGQSLEPTSCLALEDSPLGLRSAKAVGFRALAVSTSCSPSQLRGADLVYPNLGAARWKTIDGLFGP